MTDDAKSVGNKNARNEKKEAYLRAIYDRYTAEFRTIENQDALALASNAHTVMDQQLQQDSATIPDGKQIRCGKGCSHCCHGPVEIWPQEAALRAQFVHDAGLTPDLGLLERQSRYTVETWREQGVADQACVFLDAKGACSVYPSRPNTCRKLLVMSDPAFCDARQGRMDDIDRWFSWEAEMMEVAALEVFGAALMPKSLLAALNGRE